MSVCYPTKLIVILINLYLITIEEIRRILSDLFWQN
jgi:energy-converting hydrogenase Eha subunit C